MHCGFNCSVSVTRLGVGPGAIRWALGGHPGFRPCGGPGQSRAMTFQLSCEYVGSGERGAGMGGNRPCCFGGGRWLSVCRLLTPRGVGRKKVTSCRPYAARPLHAGGRGSVQPPPTWTPGLRTPKGGMDFYRNKSPGNFQARWPELRRGADPGHVTTTVCVVALHKVWVLRSPWFGP